MNSSQAFKVISIGARLLSIVVTGVLWHVTYKYIYKKIGTDSEDESKNNDDYTDCYKVIRMKIPSYAKGGIIGKNGSTIKRIQEKTKTTIKFLNKNNPSVEHSEDKRSDWNFDVLNEKDQEAFDIILIRGLTLRVMEAEKEIKIIIASIPIYNEQSMVVDNRFVGKIIGKKGENIKRLKDCYKVHIDVDRTDSPQRNIIIRGTTENIVECRRDIVKTIDLMIKEGKLYPFPNEERFLPNNNASSPRPPIELENKKNECLLKSQYAKYPGGLNEKIYIYVSSVVDCCKFYAHIVGDDQSMLSNLIDEMTEYFSSQVVSDDDHVFNVGDILAGYYEASHTWQRVKIIDAKDGLFEVIFLDYGDCSLLKASDLKTFEKGSSFLDLPFQALRLVTYGIAPIKDTWSESDINCFESLTKVGHCYQLAAYLKTKSALNLEVQLIDEASNIDIARKFIADGMAIPKD